MKKISCAIQTRFATRYGLIYANKKKAHVFHSQSI